MEVKVKPVLSLRDFLIILVLSVEGLNIRFSCISEHTQCTSSSAAGSKADSLDKCCLILWLDALKGEVSVH